MTEPMNEEPSQIQYDLVINMLADLVSNYLHQQNRRKQTSIANLHPKEWTWLRSLIEKEEEITADQELTAQLLGTATYVKVA